MRIFYPLMFPLLAVLIWATNTVVSKAAADVLDPAAISFYRWVIAALALTPSACRSCGAAVARSAPGSANCWCWRPLAWCSTSASPTTPPTPPRPPTWGSSARSSRC